MSWLFDRLTDLAVADHLTIVIDPDTGVGDPGRSEIDQMLQRARHLPDTMVWEGVRRPEAITAAEAGSVRFAASSNAECSALFSTLGPHDLGVSVGGIACGAAVHVDSPLDLASLLDALITLRSYAQRAVA
jgi:hypothetical protein